MSHPGTAYLFLHLAWSTGVDVARERCAQRARDRVLAQQTAQAMCRDAGQRDVGEGEARRERHASSPCDGNRGCDATCVERHELRVVTQRTVLTVRVLVDLVLDDLV